MSTRLLDTVTLGPRRRRRRMNDLMKELDRLDRATSLREFDKRRQKKSPKQTHRVGSFLVVLVLLAAGAGIFVFARHSAGHAKTGHPVVKADTLQGAEAIAHLDGHAPAPGIGEHKSRLLPLPTAPAGSGGYKLLDPQYGPPRYDPCRPIHYVIREQGAPAGGDNDIRQAIAALSKATGLQFIADGTTTELANPKRQPYQPKLYGDRWAPVLIAWTDPTHVPQLNGDIAGIGASQPWRVGSVGAYTYVTGAVFLDAPQLAKVQAGSGGDAGVRATIEHELGHVAGLNHVTDPTQLMYPTEVGQTGYGAGDLRGLAYEGSGACHPEL